MITDQEIKDAVAKQALSNRIENDFVFHAPKPGQTDLYEQIRENGKLFARDLLKLCPAGRELSAALTKLDEVVFWANAAIARN